MPYICFRSSVLVARGGCHDEPLHLLHYLLVLQLRVLTLLNPHYFTAKRFLWYIAGWMAYVLISIAVLLYLPKDGPQQVAILLMALWLVAYGIYLSYKIIQTYHQVVMLFDNTHSDDIAAYVSWMSIFTWWALIYGVGCGLLTFLPDRYVFLWVLSSIPFYIYLFCSYLNYLLSMRR